MKRIKSTAIAIFTLIASTAFAQTSTIEFHLPVRNFLPQLSVEGQNLLITHPTGIYSINLEDFDKSTYYQRDLYAFGGLAINNFVMNGNEILAATNNYSLNGHVLSRANLDNTKDYALFTPKAIKIDDDTSYKYIIGPTQDQSNKNNLLILYGQDCYTSDDFGETWTHSKQINEYGSIQFNSVKYSPLNPKIIVATAETDNEDVGSDFALYSIDGGATWNFLGGFHMPKSIAFHSTNADIVAVAGVSVAVSKDGCKTWEFTSELNQFALPVPYYIAFDQCGGDRLYGADTQKMNYSDDFGATWKELCELPFDGELTDFTQYGSKIYCISSECEICEIDLEKTDVGVSEVITNDAIRMRFGENQISWQSEKTISRVEVISADGIILAQQQTDSPQGEMAFNDKFTGVAVIAFYTADGQRITRKINL